MLPLLLHSDVVAVFQIAEACLSRHNALPLEVMLRAPHVGALRNFCSHMPCGSECLRPEFASTLLHAPYFRNYMCQRLTLCMSGRSIKRENTQLDTHM